MRFLLEVMDETRQTSLAFVSSNLFKRLWAIETVPSYLALGFVMIGAWWVVAQNENLIKKLVGVWFWIGWFAYERYVFW